MMKNKLIRCKCNCGNMIYKYVYDSKHFTWRKRKFINGHQANDIETNRKRRSSYLKTFSKKYPINRIFSNLNPESAYLLGLLWADGCLSKDEKVTLTNKNYQCVALLKQALGTAVPIRKSTYLKKDNHVGIVYHIEIQREEISKDLRRYGFKNKPNRLFPVLRRNLQSHFIRGYFDGDGSVFFLKKEKRIACNFTSKNIEILESIQSILATHHINSILIKPHNKLATPYLIISRKASVKNFFDYLYKKSIGIRMERKYQLFRKYPVYLERRPIKLTHFDVLEIKKSLLLNTQIEIAKHFKVNQSTISDIKNGKLYK